MTQFPQRHPLGYQSPVSSSSLIHGVTVENVREWDPGGLRRFCDIIGAPATSTEASFVLVNHLDMLSQPSVDGDLVLGALLPLRHGVQRH
jgi:hypothetical protein